jgi:hypothetical protein
MLFSTLLSLALAAPSTPDTAWPDLSIPKSAFQKNTKDVALIVSIQDYAYVSDVRGASKNATDWQTYFADVQGIPTDKIIWLQDGEATKEKIEAAAMGVAKMTEEEGKLWFVFVGHGAPSKSGNDGMLVLADAQQDPQSLYSRSMSQEWLLKTLEDGKHTETIAVIDACFSGRTENGGALAEGLQPLIATQDLYIGGTTVLSAGKHDEFAGPLPGSIPIADRPAFSYLALGALLGWGDSNADKEVTIQEVSEYTNLALKSTLVGREQHPQMNTENPEGVLGIGTMAGPDFTDIQRDSKAILERRKMLLEKGLLVERSFELTKKSKLTLGGAGALAFGSATMIFLGRQAIKSDQADLASAEDYATVQQDIGMKMNSGIGMGVGAGLMLGLGIYFNY